MRRGTRSWLRQRDDEDDDDDELLGEIESRLGSVPDPEVVPRGPSTRSLRGMWTRHVERSAERMRLFQARFCVQTGQVHDLVMQRGRLTASVGGREPFAVAIEMPPPPAGPRVDSVRASLRGAGLGLAGTALRDALIETITTRGDVLLPAPWNLRATCTCPDTVSLCKHALAVLLVFGARLDDDPGQLLQLRGFEEPAMLPGPLLPGKRMISGDLAVIFGIDLVTPAELQLPVRAAVVREPEPSLEPEPSPAPEVAPEPPSEQAEVRRDHLRVLGVRAKTIDAWLREGVLRTTDRRDVYLRTPEANRRISELLAR